MQVLDESATIVVWALPHKGVISFVHSAADKPLSGKALKKLVHVPLVMCSVGYSPG